MLLDSFCHLWEMCDECHYWQRKQQAGVWPGKPCSMVTAWTCSSSSCTTEKVLLMFCFCVYVSWMSIVFSLYHWGRNVKNYILHLLTTKIKIGRHTDQRWKTTPPPCYCFLNMVNQKWRLEQGFFVKILLCFQKCQFPFPHYYFGYLLQNGKMSGDRWYTLFVKFFPTRYQKNYFGILHFSTIAMEFLTV